MDSKSNNGRRATDKLAIALGLQDWNFICIWCKERRYVQEFYYNILSKWKDRARCIPCQRRLGKGRKKFDLEKEQANVKLVCKACQLDKLASEFGFDLRNRNGRTSHCKACRARQKRDKRLKEQAKSYEDTIRQEPVLREDNPASIEEQVKTLGLEWSV